MSNSIKLFATLAAIIFLSACESSTNGRADTSSRQSSRTASNRANPTFDAPAVHNKIRDARVLLYDPRTKATMILVNKKHAWRKNEKGQLAITNGIRNRTYKLLTDLQMDSLLETFRSRGSESIREPYNQRHASLLRKGYTKGDAFKGIIIVENNGRRNSYIARSPRGDVREAKKYQIFSQMRQAVLVFDRSGLSERVGSSATGTAPLDQLNVPRDNSHRR